MAVQADFLSVSNKSIVNVRLVDASGAILAFPKAEGADYDTGVTNTEILQPNCAGTKVRARVYQEQATPTISLTFGGKTHQLISLKLDRTIETAVAQTVDYIQQKFDVPADGVVAAAAAGVLSNGVAADVAGAVGSYVDEWGNSVPLTYGGNFAAHNDGDTITFNVGADGAARFSSDLWRRQVTYSYPVPVASLNRLTTTSYGNLSLLVSTVSIDRYVTNWVATSVNVNSEGNISLSESTQEVSFYINGDIGVESTGMLNAC